MILSRMSRYRSSKEIMFVGISLVVMGVLLTMSESIIAGQTTPEVSSTLSREVVSAMEGNQATLDSIRTMQATLKKSSSHSFPDKKGFRLMQKYRITSDGDHFRKDQLETQFDGPDENRGYATALPVGQVEIASAESNIDYHPPNNRVFVRPPEWDDRYKIRTNDILRYQSARGATLKENILASAKNGYTFTAGRETVDGDDCILLTCNYTNPEATLKIWVVPSKGYCIKRVQDGSKGKIDNEYTATLKKYSPGIWWFDTVEAKKASGRETIVSKLTVDSLILNEPVNLDIFTVWGIGVSSTTKITDEIKGATYTLAVNDVKKEVTNPASSSGKILIVGLGTLVLATFVALGVLIRRKKVR